LQQLDKEETIKMTLDEYDNLAIGDTVRVDFGTFHLSGIIQNINRHFSNIDIKDESGQLYQDFSFQLVKLVGKAPVKQSELLKELKDLVAKYDSK
jgi:hypothetical protein